MLQLVAVILLLLFVLWGATTHPTRPFSWGMYSGSTKGFFWTGGEGSPRIPSYEEMRLAPDSHYLTLLDLRQMIEQTPPAIPLQGFIIGSQGNWSVAYDGERQLLVTTPLPAGAELDHLAAALRRLSSQ